MKKLALIASILAQSIVTLAAEGQMRSVILKQDVTLNNYEQDTTHCFDMEAKKQIPLTKDKSCRDFNDRERRICEVVVYNLPSSPAVKTVSQNTVFHVTQQFGPKRDQDWDRESASLKIFSDIVGNEKTNPNLIITCYQTKSRFLGFFGGPQDFTVDEIADVLSPVLQVNQ